MRPYYFIFRMLILGIVCMCGTATCFSSEVNETEKVMKIFGKVTDKETGEPLGGAWVKVKDEKFGCASAHDGSFFMNVKPGTVLYVSHDKKETEVIRVLKDQTEYHVMLKNEIEGIYGAVSQGPEFPGGQEAYDKFIAENRMWAEEGENNKQAFVEFVVEKDGTLTNIKILYDCGNPAIKAEAFRLVNLMPKWKPGMNHGKVKRVLMKLGIDFPCKEPWGVIIDFWGDYEKYKKYEWDYRDEDGVYSIVRDMPEFPGGMVECMKYISRNIQYHAYGMHVQPRVIVQFVIEKDGSITHPVIKRGACPELDNEALRIVRQMPNWIPGKLGDEPVAVKYTLPVIFRLP